MERMSNEAARQLAAEAMAQLPLHIVGTSISISAYLISAYLFLHTHSYEHVSTDICDIL